MKRFATIKKNCTPLFGEDLLKICTVSLMILMVCCKPEAPAVAYDSSAIEGSWLVTEALRNNKHTQTINGASFHIAKDQLTHNLYGADSSYKISWGDGYIFAPRDTYQIESVVDSFLILNVILHKFNFKISLKKLSDQTETSEAADSTGAENY